jgi:rubredoxin
MNYSCPVCGFDELRYPAKADMICPCCGVQFGYDDFAKTHEQLRGDWLANGAAWQSRRIAPPAGWSPKTQLAHAGLLDRSMNAVA